MKKKNKACVNFLDFIPVICENQQYKEDEEGHIVVCMERKSIYDKMARVIRKSTPRYSCFTLDDHGSFVWRQIDGVRSVYEIGKLVREAFGEDAEPLYERLSKFIQILERNQFVEYRK